MKCSNSFVTLDATDKTQFTCSILQAQRASTSNATSTNTRYQEKQMVI